MKRWILFALMALAFSSAKANQPSLYLDLHSWLTEGQSTMAKIWLTTESPEPVHIELRGDGVIAPSTVTVAAATPFIEFEVTAVDDKLINEPRDATLTATATGFQGDTSTVLIYSDDVDYY